jgi:hypothetical protein
MAGRIWASRGRYIVLAAPLVALLAACQGGGSSGTGY